MAIEQANNIEDQSMNKMPKRISTSSQEIGENEINDDTLENLNNLSLISGHSEREDLHRQWETSHRSDDQQDPFYNRPPRPGSSGFNGRDRENRTTEDSAEQRARRKSDDVIREAEASKARILHPKGNRILSYNENQEQVRIRHLDQLTFSG